MVQPRFKAYRQIVRCFGTGILLENGEIDREALGSVIFHEPEKRQLLNSITHPQIRAEMLKQILKYFVLGKGRLRRLLGQELPLLAAPVLLQPGEGWGGRKGTAVERRSLRSVASGRARRPLEDSLLPFTAALRHLLLPRFEARLRG